VTRALVTGAGGFVGRWLVPALRRLRIDVTGVGQDNGPDDWHDVTWLIGDLRDTGFVTRAVERARPDWVIHLAAISHVPTAAADPAAAWDTNVTATARLLAAIARWRDGAQSDPVILVAGSAEQYGRHDVATIDETVQQEPRTVYAATKAAQELLALQQWRASGLRVVAARSFNHSGAGQTDRFLLPALVARAVALRDTPGAVMRVGNTTPVRDFLHVSDVVAAYIALLQTGVAGEPYNVASGVGRSVESVVQRVLARLGVDASLETDPTLVRPVDVPSLVGDAGKLQRATAWRPQRTFDDILDDLIHAATR
jgi:GDP-4-dehydro-6-deoxy-D-mannose reductase